MRVLLVRLPTINILSQDTEEFLCRTNSTCVRSWKEIRMKFVIGAYLSLALITVLAVRSTAGGSSQSWCWLPRAGQWVHSSKFAAFHSQYEVHGTDLWVSSGGSAAPTVLKDVCRPSGRGQGHPVPAPKEAQDSLKAAILEKGSKFQFLSTRSGLNYAIVTNGCITKGGQVALFYPQVRHAEIAHSVTQPDVVCFHT